MRQFQNIVVNSNSDKYKFVMFGNFDDEGFLEG